METLAEAGCALAGGALPPLAFNESIIAFPPKGTDPLDTASAATREPGDTRPLSLKNTDNKTIAGVYNHKLRVPIAKSANKCQNGFVFGRQFLSNVIQLDARARSPSLVASPRNAPAAFLPLLI